MKLVLILPLACVACLCEAFSAEHGPLPAGCQATVLSILLNGVRPQGVDSGGTILFDCNGQLFAKRQDLAAWTLRPPPSGGIADQDGTLFFSLSEIPGLSYAVDQSRQILIITVSGSGFATTATISSARPAGTRFKPGIGAFLNYDLGIDHKAMSSLNGFGELGSFGPWGLITSTFIRRSFSDRPLTRLDTTLVYDWPSRLQSLRVGDSVTSAGLWGRSVYFGGLRWGTDFETQPDFVTFPSPTIRGEAVAPSTAELYVNNALRWSSSVPPGPFEIRNPPLIAGAGQMMLVVRDPLGRESVISRQYYASAAFSAKVLRTTVWRSERCAADTVTATLPTAGD